MYNLEIVRARRHAAAEVTRLLQDSAVGLSSRGISLLSFPADSFPPRLWEAGRVLRRSVALDKPPLR